MMFLVPKTHQIFHMYICKIMLSEFFVNLLVNARASNFTQEGDSPAIPTPSNHRQLIMGALQPIQVKKKDNNCCERNRISCEARVYSIILVLGLHIVHKNVARNCFCEPKGVYLVLVLHVKVILCSQ